MFTKAEMEDIWHNKPVGYLKNLSKKKLKRFKFTITAIEEIEKAKETIEVFAKNATEARYSDGAQKLKSRYYEKYPKHMFVFNIKEI